MRYYRPRRHRGVRFARVPFEREATVAVDFLKDAFKNLGEAAFLINKALYNMNLVTHGSPVLQKAYEKDAKALKEVADKVKFYFDRNKDSGYRLEWFIRNIKNDEYGDI